MFMDNQNTTPVEPKDHIKERYMEFKLLQEHIEKLTEHVNLLLQQQVQIEDTKESLLEISRTAIGSEILVPIADGVFLKAALKDNNLLLVNVGSGAVVPRSTTEVSLMILAQQQRVSENITEAKALLEQFESEAMGIYKEVEEHVR